MDQIQIIREISTLADVYLAAVKISGAGAAGMVREVHLTVTMSDGSVERVPVEPFGALQTIGQIGQSAHSRLIGLSFSMPGQVAQPEPKPETEPEVQHDPRPDVKTTLSDVLATKEEVEAANVDIIEQVMRRAAVEG